MTLWIAGGRQSREAGVADRQHDGLYDEGRVVRVDADGTPTVVHRGPELFKGMARDGARLLLCTATEVLWLDPVGGAVVDRWSHPWLDDVHHAVVHDGRLWVVSTGADGVLEVGADRAEVRFHPAVAGAVAPSGDVRGREKRGPHASHPNHLFVRDGALWVTRFHQRDAIRVLAGPEASGADRLEVEYERPHDGLVDGSSVWFTTVDGALVRSAAGVAQRVGLQAPDATGEPLGWCRGLALDGADAWVGFTRIRATRWRSNLAWARGALRGRQDATRRPSWVGRFDRTTGALRATLSLEAVSLDAVFSLLSDALVGSNG